MANARPAPPQTSPSPLRQSPGPSYWQSTRALAIHWPKPLATMLRMTAARSRKGLDFAGLSAAKKRCPRPFPYPASVRRTALRRKEIACLPCQRIARSAS